MPPLSPAIRTPAILVGLILLLLLLPFDVALGNPLPVWEDGQFVDGTWSHEVLVTPGEGNASVTRVTGGNPDACLSVTTDATGPLWVALWCDLAWNLGDGAIEYLTLQIDEKAVMSAGSGQNLKLLVHQDGRNYVAPVAPVTTGTGSDPDWQTVLYPSLAASDFAEIPDWPGAPAAHPDFSAAGGLICFGFAVGVESTPFPLTHLYDNWFVFPMFTPVSVEPGSPARESWAGVKERYR